MVDFSVLIVVVLIVMICCFLVFVRLICCVFSVEIFIYFGYGFLLVLRLLMFVCKRMGIICMFFCSSLLISFGVKF